MPTINSAKSSTGWSDNFAGDKSLNRSIWQAVWGKSDDFKFGGGSLTLTSTQAEGWSAVGFMRPDFNASSGDGYGRYSVTASLNKGEGGGVNLVLWPANNKWPGAELDLLESNDASRESGYTTVHFKGNGNSDAFYYNTIKVDLTQKNTFAIDWQKGSLTYYLNGKELFQTTRHVPVDAADGGVNESFGAQVTGAQYNPVSSKVSLHLYSMSYTPHSGASVAAPAPTPAAVATIAAAPAPTMQFSHATGATVPLVSGALFNEQGSHNTLSLPATGSAVVSGNILSDTLDLRSAMAATGWDHRMSDLAKYVSLAKTSSGVDLSLHKASGGSVLSLTIDGQHPTLASIESHALFT